MVMSENVKNECGPPGGQPRLCPGAVHDGIPEVPGRPFVQFSPSHHSIGDSTPIAERMSGTIRLSTWFDAASHQP